MAGIDFVRIVWNSGVCFRDTCAVGPAGDGDMNGDPDGYGYGEEELEVERELEEELEVDGEWEVEEEWEVEGWGSIRVRFG